MFSDIFFTLFPDFLGGVTEKRVSLLPLGILCRRAVFRRVFRFPDFQEKLAKNSPYSPITRLLLAKTRQKLAKTRLNSPKTRLNSPKLAHIWVQILVQCAPGCENGGRGD